MKLIFRQQIHEKQYIHICYFTINMTHVNEIFICIENLCVHPYTMFSLNFAYE